MKVEKSKKGVENFKPLGVESQGGEVDISPSQKEVLILLTKEFLTIKQIALRRKTSIQAIYKIIGKLKQKGILGLGNRGLKGVEKKQSTFQPPPNFKPPFNKIRLHGQEFNIRILFKDHRYKGKVGGVVYIDGNTIRLFRDTIEVYSGQSFYADDVQKATIDSFKYWNRFFLRLESEFKVILIKPRSQNIKLVNQHYSEVNNEFAEECERKGDKIKVYTTEDGKLWFTIDNSFNLHEAETLHPQTAKEDMSDSVRPFFNDLRDNRPPTLSQLMQVFDKIAKINEETASGLNCITNFIRSQFPAEEEGEGERPNYLG